MEITAELLQVINETSWTDGIGTLAVLLIAYALYKYINKRFK
jgi:hypothetical protein